MRPLRPPSPRELPVRWLRKKRVVFHAPARLGHHGLYGVAPREVVRGLLVTRRVRGRAVDLDEKEPRRVAVLLHDIEAYDARFLHAVARVLERGGPESVDGVGLYVNEDVDDDHEWVGVLDGETCIRARVMRSGLLHHWCYVRSARRRSASANQSPIVGLFAP